MRWRTASAVQIATLLERARDVDHEARELIPANAALADARDLLDGAATHFTRGGQ